ncbi:spore coat protein H [Candidatus Desulfofervidus auxilii]|uniref:Spore coat protein H n=1 Tax=Desulfofervidus auxilii TaxID=1621989 RepID=A0A7U4QLE6_DESA2|nr:hypothetical protein [Candidatus Desulfofervidus auxilii]AMM41510.1 spore coat protein H [Candidatus Desulfofervidus auxilii]CAD7778446.1 hypothetical protein BLFGPEAP_01996 [Candidatus Methanoperedenaceae archaeon GB50]
MSRHIIIISIIFFGLLGWQNIVFPQTPISDIKVNGLDEPTTLNQSDALTITVSLNNNQITDNADWWLAADTPFGLYFFTFYGWTTDWAPAHQGPLFHLAPFEVLNMPVSGFPAGRYTIYFGVDTNMDGDVTWDSLYVDSVVANIVSGEASGYMNSVERMAKALFDTTYKNLKASETMSFLPFSPMIGTTSKMSSKFANYTYTYGCVRVEIEDRSGTIYYDECYGLDGSIHFTYDFSGSTYVLHYNYDLTCSYYGGSCDITGLVTMTVSYEGADYTISIDYGDSFYVCGQPISGSCLITYNETTGKYTYSYDFGEYTGYYNGQTVRCDWNNDFTYDGQYVNGSGTYADADFTLSYEVADLCYDEQGIPTGGIILGNFTYIEKDITFKIEITSYSDGVATYSIIIWENGEKTYSKTGQYPA